MSRWSSLALCLVLSACGRESDRGFTSQDVNFSLEGRALLTANARLELGGMRFTKNAEGRLIWDSGFYRQVRLERPFITHSAEVRALVYYVTTAHQVLEKFGEKQSLDIPARRDFCLDHIKEIRGHVRAEGEPESFLKDTLELAKAEEGLASVGIRFIVNAGSGRATVDSVAFEAYRLLHPGNDIAWKANAQEFVEAAKTFIAKYQQELSSPLVELKAEAVQALLALLERAPSLR